MQSEGGAEYYYQLPVQYGQLGRPTLHQHNYTDTQAGLQVCKLQATTTSYNLIYILSDLSGPPPHWNGKHPLIRNKSFRYSFSSKLFLDGLPQLYFRATFKTVLINYLGIVNITHKLLVT